MAHVKPSQNGDTSILKGLCHNGIYIFNRPTIYKRPENNPGNPIQVASQVQLRKHPVNAVGGFSAVFQEKQMLIKAGLIRGAYEVTQVGKIPANYWA
jgi:hypothetical protein